MLLQVDKAQFNTILAALRIYQQALNMNGGVPPADVDEIASDGSDHLTDEAIDELCEGINGGSLQFPDECELWLTLSSAHSSPDELYWLEEGAAVSPLRLLASCDYGAFFYLDTEDADALLAGKATDQNRDEFAEHSPGLISVIRYMRSRELTYVRFDADANEVSWLVSNE